MGNRYLEPTSGKSKNRYLDSGGQVKNRYLQDAKAIGDPAALEQRVQDEGASSFLDTAKTIGGNVIDIISRPNYAIAGAAEELFAPQGGGALAALKRAGTELASGIGGLQGQKEGFAQVMEQAGVGKGFEFSELAPFLYSDSGDGWKFQRGGAFDPTGRGLGGFVLDVALDPTTYLGGTGLLKKVGAGGATTLSKVGTALYREEFGKALGSVAAKASAVADVKALETARGAAARATADIAREFASVGTEAHAVLRKKAAEEAEARVLKAAETAPHLLDQGGIHWAGHTIPGTPALATAGADVSDWVIEELGKYKFGAAALATAEKGQKALKAIPNLFVPGWTARNLEGFRDLYRDVNNKQAMEIGRAMNLIGEEQAKRKWTPDALKRMAIAVDEGTIHTLQDPAEQATAMWIAKESAKIMRDDYAAGIQFRAVDNYLHHMYDNTPEELEKVVTLYKGDVPRLGPSEGFREERTFETLRKAEEWSTKQHAYDPSVPILKPVYDPFESLRRRSVLSVKARNFRAFEKELVARYGADATRFNVQEAFDLAGRAGRKLAPKEEKAVAGILAADRATTDKVASVGALSDEGKRAFFEDRLLQAKSPREVVKILQKYESHSDHFPKATGWAGDVAADGSNWRMAKLRTGEYRLPDTLVKSLAYLDKPLLEFRGPEGNALKQLLRATDWINNTFKLGVTAWPAFHVRNLYSNVAQSFPDVGVAIFDPRIRHNSIAMLMGRDGVFKTPVGDYSLAELRKIFEESGIIVPGNSLLEYTGRDAKGTAARRMVEKYQKNIGGRIENEARAAHALALLRQGHSVDEAVRRVNQFLFDYSSLTQAERQFFRRVFPFWTWQSRNMVQQVDNLLKRPGALANEVKPFRGRENENRELTSWDAGAFKLRLNNDGKTLTTITGIDLPIRNLDLLWRGSLAKTLSGIGGMTTPIVKAPVEYGTGYNLFLGRPFNRKESTVIGKAVEHLPKGVQDWMGYIPKTDAAGRTHYTFDGPRFYALFQAWAVSRFVSTSDRQFRRYLDDQNMVGIFSDVMGGFRFNEWDMDEQRAKMVKERLDELERARVRRGTMREFRKAYEQK